MKQKKFFFLAAAAGLFAACSESDFAEKQSPQQTVDDGAITFGAYMQRATTRAGASGIMTNPTLQASGFGVFGYYTDNNDYEQTRIPDFFYNQKLSYNSKWVYEPVKYWPNEYGSSAISDDNDRVSFFAYAPYVEVTPASGKLVKVQSDDDQWGITGMSNNRTNGDPIVKYIASFEEDKSVDLLWGVCDDTNWPVIQGGTVQKINDGKQGLPWLNVQRPKDTNHQMNFQFHHALAQLSATVDAYVDDIVAGKQVANGTKIYVRSISFTGIAMKGALNLNNEDPNRAKWMDYNGTADLESGAPVVVYDQLKDGKEGTQGAVATNEKVGGLNPNIISNWDTGVNKGNTTIGVTATAQELFKSPNVMIIPTGEAMEVEIVYDVETTDPNLSTLLSDGKTTGSSVENRIKKTVSFGENNLQNGYRYKLQLHLGMNSVKIDADVTSWMDDAERPEADLPLNMPSFQALSTPVISPVNIAANTNDTQDYVFAVTGLQPGEEVNAAGVGLSGVTKALTFTVNNKPDFTGTPTPKANDSGIAYVKIGSIPAYNKTSNTSESGYISVKGNSSNNEARIAVTQLARDLKMKGFSIADDNKTLTISTEKALEDAAQWNGGTLTLKKNGSTVTPSTTLTGSATDKATIVLSEALTVGDVVEITYQVGDAHEETITMTLGGIKFSNPVTSIAYQEKVTNQVILVGAGNVEYTTTAADYIDCNSTTGEIEGKKKHDDNEVKATLTATDNTPDGIFYNTSSRSATYNINVTPQIATISLSTPAISTITSSTTAVTVATWAAVLKDAKGDEITGATKPTVTYSLSDNTRFELGTDGEVKLNANVAAGSYPLTVTATAANDGDYYTFGTAGVDNVKTSTVTVVVVAAAP